MNNHANSPIAGIPLEKVAGTQTGVYVGCFSSDYRSIMEKDLDQDLKYAATGVCERSANSCQHGFCNFPELIQKLSRIRSLKSQG